MKLEDMMGGFLVFVGSLILVLACVLLILVPIMFAVDWLIDTFMPDRMRRRYPKRRL